MVESWHNRAEEARVIAHAMTHEETRQIMLSIAVEFERLARLALQSESLTQKTIERQTADLRKVSAIVEMFTRM
jgi:hypothetical protein